MNNVATVTTTPEVTTTEPVVTPPTPEQVAEAQEILSLAAALQVNSAHSSAGEVSILHVPTVLNDNTLTPIVAPESYVEIPAQVVARLTAKFNAAMTNPKFFANQNRITRLDDALVIPIFDDRSMHQFAISAREELTRIAMEIAIKNQAVPVEPTDQQIAELAKKKFDAKQAKIAAKEAKKKA